MKRECLKSETKELFEDAFYGVIDYLEGFEEKVGWGKDVERAYRKLRKLNVCR